MLLPTMLMLLQATTTPSTTPTPTPSPTPSATPSPSPTPTPSTTPSVLPVVGSLIPVCLTRTVKDSRGVDQAINVIVAPGNAAGLVKNGFATRTCGAARLSTASYKAEVCKMAAFGNGAVQRRFEQVLGVKPKLLCDDLKGLEGVLPLSL